MQVDHTGLYPLFSAAVVARNHRTDPLGSAQGLINNLTATLVLERPVPVSDSNAALAWTAHNEIASRLAHESTVLLQNNGKAAPAVLPLVPVAVGATVILLHPPLPFSRFFNRDGEGTSAK